MVLKEGKTNGDRSDTVANIIDAAMEKQCAA